MEYLTYEEFERRVQAIEAPVTLTVDKNKNSFYTHSLVVMVSTGDGFDGFDSYEILIEIDKDRPYRMKGQEVGDESFRAWQLELQELAWQLAGTPIEERREKEYIFPMGKDIDNVSVYAAFTENFVDQTCSITPARIKIMYTREELDKLIVKYPYLEPFVTVHCQLWKPED